MYIVKNAWVSIKRNLGRNVLIGLVIMVIACFLTISLAIKNTSDDLINSYEEASTITATISFNRGNMMEKFDPQNEDSFKEMKEDFNNISSLTVEDINKYGTSKYVQDYYYTLSLNIDADIESASSEFSFGKGGRNNETMGEQGAFTLMGYSSLTAMQEFINGTYTIDSATTDVWTQIFNADTCLINYDLATLNSLSVGDSITIEASDTTKTLEIVGIFKEVSTSDANARNMFASSANTIIVSSNLIENLEVENLNVTPYYTLTSKNDVEAFSSDVASLGLDENYQVTTNENEVESAVSSVKNVGSFATTFLILTFIIGAVVLLVINVINIRERKYEIGVLRTIGMKKSSVVKQFVTELLIVSLVGLILGASLGAVLAKPISNNLLASEVDNSQETQETIERNFGGARNFEETSGNNMKMDMNKMGVATIQAYDSIDAVVDFKVILELIFICLLLTLIGSLAAIINIIRFRPLSILKERT